MNFKGIKRRIDKLAAASKLPVAYQAEELVRHWCETGEFSYPDGSRVSVEVFRHIVGTAISAGESDNGTETNVLATDNAG
jgi:hypothetical protein